MNPSVRPKQLEVGHCFEQDNEGQYSSIQPFTALKAQSLQVLTMRQHFVVADSTFSRSEQLWHPIFTLPAMCVWTSWAKCTTNAGASRASTVTWVSSWEFSFPDAGRSFDVLLIVSLKFYVSITVLQRSQGYQVFDFCFSHDSQSRSSRGLDLEILIVGTRHVFDCITGRTVAILILSDIDFFMPETAGPRLVWLWIPINRSSSKNVHHIPDIPAKRDLLILVWTQFSVHILRLCCSAAGLWNSLPVVFVECPWPAWKVVFFSKLQVSHHTSRNHSSRSYRKTHSLDPRVCQGHAYMLFNQQYMIYPATFLQLFFFKVYGAQFTFENIPANICKLSGNFPNPSFCWCLCKRFNAGDQEVWWG